MMLFFPEFPPPPPPYGNPREVSTSGGASFSTRWTLQSLSGSHRIRRYRGGREQCDVPVAVGSSTSVAKHCPWGQRRKFHSSRSRGKFQLGDGTISVSETQESLFRRLSDWGEYGWPLTR